MRRWGSGRNHGCDLVNDNQCFYVIACHVLWRELCHFAALSRHVFLFYFLEQGLHNTPGLLRKKLQQAIDAAPESCSAVLIGYGLCCNGVEGIVARDKPLVLMRGHDCITFLLGSRRRYREYFDAHPGTYWYSPGWIDTNAQPGKDRFDKALRRYIETYGEENAEYLIQTEQAWMERYSNAAYVDLGFGDSTRYIDYTQQCAAWLGWNCDVLKGDPQLVINFLEGNWNAEEYLVVNPGQRIAASYDESIFTAVEARPGT